MTVISQAYDYIQCPVCRERGTGTVSFCQVGEGGWDMRVVWEVSNKKHFLKLHDRKSILPYLGS